MPNKTKKKTKKTKYMYFQDWGTYGIESIVVVGYNHKEILQKLKKLGARKEILKEIEEEKKSIEPFMRGCGFFVMLEKTGANILWFSRYGSDWDFIETLIHELFHAVHDCLGTRKSMMEEDDAMAYQQEFLFRSIRRKLCNYFKK